MIPAALLATALFAAPGCHLLSGVADLEFVDQGGSSGSSATGGAGGQAGHGGFGAGGGMGGASPLELASNEGSIEDIAIDDTHVYWLSAGQVRRVDKTGGQVASIGPLVDTPIQLQADGTYVYLSSGAVSGVYRLVIADGSLALFAETGGALTHGLAQDASFVYWTENPEGYVARIGKADGSPVEPLTSGQNAPTLVAVNATQVVWYNEGDDSIQALPVAGGTPTYLVAGQAAVDLAIDDTAAVWTSSGAGAVIRYDFASQTSDTLEAGLGDPGGIALVAGRAFACDATAGRIVAVPVAGGAVEDVASDPGGPRHLVADGTGLYWSNDSGQVLHLPISR